MPLKSWVVGNPNIAQEVTSNVVSLFTGQGQQLITSRVQNYEIANTMQDTKFWFVKQAGKEIGGIFKADQMKGFQQFQNPTPSPSFINHTPKPTQVFQLLVQVLLQVLL